MLKFRQSSSIRARRKSERQRKALEEKVKMEWAWMPLAAVMNEKATDLVYWVPPIYTSKLGRTSCTSSKSSSFKSNYSSIRRTPSRKLTVRRLPSSAQAPPKRKRKLCQRRTRLRATNSVLGDMEPDAEFGKTSLIRQEALENHSVDVEESKSESEKSADESLIPFPEVRQRNSSFKQKASERKSNDNQKLKVKNASSLLKLLEKITNMYSLGNSKKPFSRSRPNVKSKKSKRPSVKLYSVPSQRLVGKREKLFVEDFSTLKHSMKSHGSTKLRKLNSINEKKADVSQITDEVKKEDNSLNEGKQIAQLQLALTVLVNYFEKKFEAQNNEIELMKLKLQRQEKVLKHTAQLSLQMKNHMTTVNGRLDNIELIGAKIYKQEECFMPYVALESFNEETTRADTSDSCTESCEESISVSQTSSHRRKGALSRHKLFISQSKDSDSNEFPEKYRTAVKLQINGDSFTD